MKNMDNDEKKRIADYFDPWDLVELLGLTTEEVVEAFEDIIDEKLNAIEELMGVTHE
jgi:NTP pyrophosphatase (non-canonical NTP hydrolase)